MTGHTIELMDCAVDTEHGQDFACIFTTDRYLPEGHPPIACRKGCPSSGTRRVTALAPEVFMVAAYLRGHGIDLIGRLRETDTAQSHWLGRGDPLAPAAVDLEHRGAMAAGFDAVVR